uniref:Endoglucanase n=1 Tax=Ciona savignyi TaxID=51511 RepID=H2YYI6_CIOSA
MDYNEMLHKSLLFYEAQMSGELPDGQRIPWRGDSNIKDGCSAGKDLSGGWYNGGGEVKTTSLIAFTTTLLAWGAIDYGNAYEAAGEMDKVLQQIRWAANYLIKCHTGLNELVVQVGKYKSAQGGWTRPEDNNGLDRPMFTITSTQPGSDAAADVSAALAASSILFNQSDPVFAALCLQHARQLFVFADTHRGVSSAAIPRSFTRYYSYSGAEDELAWAAVWLHKATRESDYLDRAQTFHGDITNHRNIFFWDDKTKGVEILLAKATNSRRYKTPVLAFANWLQTSTYKIPGGMVWLNYRGANMHTANVAFLSLQAAELADRESDTLCFLNFSTTQLGFLTGSRSSQGYVVGLGLNSPRNPHHRASSCPPEPAACSRDAISQGSTNAHVLYGALVGGPDQFGRYVDRASDYLRNEVAIDFNAGFQSLVAGAKHWEM